VVYIARCMSRVCQYLKLLKAIMLLNRAIMLNLLCSSIFHQDLSLGTQQTLLVHV